MKDSTKNLYRTKNMNSFVFIHMGGVEGGTTFILVILAVFVLICTHILSYLFFFQNTNVGIIVLSYV